MNDHAVRTIDLIMEMADSISENLSVGWKDDLAFIGIDPWLAKQYWPRFARLVRQTSSNDPLQAQWEYLWHMGDEATVDMFVDAWNDTRLSSGDYWGAPNVLDKLAPPMRRAVIDAIVRQVRKDDGNLADVWDAIGGRNDSEKRDSVISISYIRPCGDHDFEAIYSIVNDAAQAYQGVIPADCWHDPYMSKEQLRDEIASAVRFWGLEVNGQLVGVMGIQDVDDVTLVRHAYVRTANRNQGIGGKLLCQLRSLTARPILIGTWAAATWAIRFYERHGFRQVATEEKDRLLRKYWRISERQVETSVVLAENHLGSPAPRCGSRRESPSAG